MKSVELWIEGSEELIPLLFVLSKPITDSTALRSDGIRYRLFRRYGTQKNAQEQIVFVSRVIRASFCDLRTEREILIEIAVMGNDNC